MELTNSDLMMLAWCDEFPLISPNLLNTDNYNSILKLEKLGVIYKVKGKVAVYNLTEIGIEHLKRIKTLSLHS